MKITKLFTDFFESEKSSGFLLIICVFISILLSNSSVSETYCNFWHYPIGKYSIEFWINDGLMTLFFLLIGLELKREIFIGELSKLKEALLPIFGALGGMLFPVLFYLFFNFETPTQSGLGIPMATDIAFALGILSLLGNKVPVSLKIFLTALAVIDDLGAIIIIAIFYTKTIIWKYLILATILYILLLIFNKLKIRNIYLYIIGGSFLWYFMLHSGIHATISGVLLAFALPFDNGNKQAASYILQHQLHKPIAFIILPIFAIANTAIVFHVNFTGIITQNYSLGILSGLILGKPLGIFIISFLAVSTKICTLPKTLCWRHIFGVGFLGGIGFTMSIFITLLAFNNTTIINNAKIIIVLSSIIAATLGFLMLQFSLKQNK